MGKKYQWEEFIGTRPGGDIESWTSGYGPVVVKRTSSRPVVRFQVLVDNPNIDVYLVGKFNDWKKDPVFKLQPDENHIIFQIETDAVMHNQPYKFLVVQGKREFLIQDPAGHYFDDDGNSIFWDYGSPLAYKQKNGFIDTINRSTRVLQTDLPGLIVHWKDPSGRMGRDIDPKDYYKFITDSGVLEHIKNLGFNTIQFLPFAQSIDGDNWKFRYLVPFQFAIQKNWGSPDYFARMIDECHRLGIAVIGDFIIGHLPFKDFKIFSQSCNESGIHQWVNRHGTKVYMKEETSWGTMRTDFDSSHVRNFIISSCLHFMKRYRIDGFRIDNVDGIIRYGPAGDGEERPNGRRFLRELNRALYKGNPHALIHFESHYFYKDNAKMLVIPFDEDERALGATAYNSSRMTYYFHTEYMLKDVKEITPWRFRDIAEEKEWGQSNSTIADFHNHDAAAGLIELRATGSYAYDAMTGKQPHNHFHAIGKIKVMESIISFCAEGRTLDLVQTFLLQMGTFEHDSSIQWFQAFNQCNNNMVEYKRKVNELMDDEAFWPINAHRRKFLNVDDKNKVMVIERSSDKSRYIIVINLSAWGHHDYKVGLTAQGTYTVELNADLFEYAGTGTVSYPKEFQSRPSRSFEVLDKELVLNKIAPYGVVVLKIV